ncbi:hypothetical protein K8R33_05055 [archaeon]|nr:hypothetical protein [archaeon]
MYDTLKKMGGYIVYTKEDGRRDLTLAIGLLAAAGLAAFGMWLGACNYKLTQDTRDQQIQPPGLENIGSCDHYLGLE